MASQNEDRENRGGGDDDRRRGVSKTGGSYLLGWGEKNTLSPCEKVWQKKKNQEGRVCMSGSGKKVNKAAKVFMWERQWGVGTLNVGLSLGCEIRTLLKRIVSNRCKRRKGAVPSNKTEPKNRGCSPETH